MAVATAVAFLFPADASAQKARELAVVVDSTVHVSAARGDFPHIEVHLSASASRPAFLLGAAMVFTPEAQYVPRLTAFTSQDGGRTWTASVLPLPDDTATYPWPGFLDPWTTVATDGAAYVAGLRITAQGGEIYVWRSRDGGRRWEPPVRLPRGDGGTFDHPVIFVVPAGRGGRGTVYVFANQAGLGAVRGASGNSLSRSTDGAATFAAPVMVLPNNLQNQNGNLVAFSDGSVMAAWFELSGAGERRVRHPRLWTSLSTDGGRSFLPPRLVVEGYTGSWPILDIDRSEGARKDRVYAAWTGIADSAGKEDDRVFIAWSDDRGATWSAPNAVHARSRARSNVMMAASPEGVVGVSWYEWAGDCTQLVFAASADHGESFSDPQRISPPWCPSAPQPGNRVPLPWRSATVADRWPTGGDYHGLVASPGREFRVFWVDAHTGVFQVYTAAIRLAPSHRR
jgi:hypothetical protein